MAGDHLMKHALLLGGSGFVGRHMARLLRSDYQVTSVGSECDIRDQEKIDTLVEWCRPDVVINFAFITTVGETYAEPEKTYDIGFHGMLNLLHALQHHKFNGKILNISSSEVYGYPCLADLPMSENTALRPMSPYSVAKLSVEALCYQWCHHEGFNIITARPFTHIGPDQSDRFALSSFSRQIAEMKLNKKEHVMHVGNLNGTRDITDVRDVVRSYAMLLNHGKRGDIYNVCSGNELRISVLLDQMITYSGLSVRVEQDEKLIRNSEQIRVCGDNLKLRNATGWHPVIPLEKTLEDMVNAWEKRLDNQ